MKLQKIILFASVLLGISFTSVYGASTINFDDVYAPYTFDLTSALTDAYASQGVHFSGGGAILQYDSFVDSAYSGTNLLAFNTTTYATGPETITFDNLANNVSIYANCGDSTSDNPVMFSMTAYDANNSILRTADVTLTTPDWSLLSVNASGIKKIELVETGSDAFVYDDLSFDNNPSSVPIPATLWILGSGLIGLLGIRRHMTS
jgi:hypothetical protein